MSPETGATPPMSRPPTRHTGRSDAVNGGHGTSGGSAVDALAAARQQIATSIPPASRPRLPRVRTGWLLLAALAGTLPAFLAPSEHATRATLRIQGPQAATRAEVYRRSLLDFAWRHLEGIPELKAAVHWSVETPHPDYLALNVSSTDGRRGQEIARDIARGFVEDMHKESETLRSTQSETEILLTSYAGQLRQRMESAEAQVAARAANTNGRTPAAEYESLTARWTSARTDFEKLRGQLITAAAHLAQLQAAGEPAHGLVSVDDRQEALAADLTLQQDLKELRVNLSELKLHLLNAWKESSVPLDSLATETKALLAAIGRTARDSHPLPGMEQEVTDRDLDSLTRHLNEEVTEFSAAWNREFGALRQLEADPMTGAIIDVHERVRQLLNKFLFDSGQQMSRLRASIRESDMAGDDARHHVRQSELLHAFHALQAAHHRFELVASELETRSNFQIDAALRSATGLHRRSQHQVRVIDERLERKAAEQARGEYRVALARATVGVEDLRTRADRLVGELVTLQESLNIQAGLSAEFLRESLTAEHAGREAGLARSDLDILRQHQRTLEEKRRATLGDTVLSLVDIRPVSDWTHAWRRLRVGLAGALIAVLAVLVGQWLVQRQGGRAEAG